MNRNPDSRRILHEINLYDAVNGAARGLATAQFTLEQLTRFMSNPQHRFGQGRGPAFPQWRAYDEAVRSGLILPGPAFEGRDRIALVQMPEFQQWVAFDDRFKSLFNTHYLRIRRAHERAVMLSLVLEVVALLTPLVGPAVRAIAMSPLMRSFLRFVLVAFGRLRLILGGPRVPLVFPVVISQGTTAAELRMILLRIWEEFPPIQSLHRVARSGATRAQVEAVLHEFFRETRVGWQTVPRGEVGRMTGRAGNRATIREGLLLIDEDVLQNPATFLEEVNHEICSNYVFGVRGSRVFPQIRGAGLTPPKYLEMMVEEGAEPVLRFITVD
jgi:hypothetical protein